VEISPDPGGGGLPGAVRTLGPVFLRMLWSICLTRFIGWRAIAAGLVRVGLGWRLPSGRWSCTMGRLRVCNAGPGLLWRIELPRAEIRLTPAEAACPTFFSAILTPDLSSNWVGSTGLFTVTARRYICRLFLCRVPRSVAQGSVLRCLSLGSLSSGYLFAAILYYRVPPHEALNGREARGRG